jgi:predicted extracellular nuclease
LVTIDLPKPNNGDTSVRNPLLLVLGLLLLMDALSARAQVPIEWQQDGTGQLIGARYVDIGGVLYDVSFGDGLCINLFSGCNNTADFVPFTTESAALAAAIALEEQVFVDSAPGGNPPFPFDTSPGDTSGCTFGETSCNVLIPYAARQEPNADILVSLRVFENLPDQLADEQSFVTDSLLINGTVLYVLQTPPGMTTWANFTLSPPPPLRIHDIQGFGPAVALTIPVEVSAIVVGDFQASDQLTGFFVQEENADADAAPETSEGIFVYCDPCPVDVSVGDHVRVIGVPGEAFGMSQITATGASDVAILSTGNPLPTPATFPLGDPYTLDASYEAFEGMLVTVPGTLSAGNISDLDRYGQLVLTFGRFFHYTHQNIPNVSGYAAHLDNLSRSSIVLDDDDDTQNAPLLTSDPTVFHPEPAFSAGNYVRTGDTIDDLTGVLHWAWSGSGGTDAWRIRPVVEAFDYAFTPNNPRPTAPDTVAGATRVALLNLLNYFTTLDTSFSGCGQFGFEQCRGANTAAELARQTEKTVATLCALDADVIALVEIENGAAAGDAVGSLAASINAEGATGCPGPYQAIDAEPLGTDVIKVGLLYRPDRVTPQGAAAVLDTAAFVDPPSSGVQRNLPALAQTFLDESGETFTVVVNHWKAKGCLFALGADLDQGDGQECYASTRTLAANELASWLATDPTSSGDADFLVVGELNSWALEDPIQVLGTAGYTNLIQSHLGANAYSYSFRDQLGYFDHALASASLAPKVQGIVQWHINTDEADLLDYNDTLQDAGESFFEAKPPGTTLYDGTSPARSSDHDPIVVVVPEPSALVPGLLGLAGLARRSGARRRS